MYVKVWSHSKHVNVNVISFELIHSLEYMYIAKAMFGMTSVQVPTSLCIQNKLIIHSRYCFVEQYVYPREPNIYMGNLYLGDE